MTYREKLAEMNSIFIGDVYVGGCYSCPDRFFFGANTKCEENKTQDEEKCSACWNQEIPENLLKNLCATEKVLLPRGKDAPQILDSGNREEDTRKKILKDAIYCVCTDRKQQYGKPENSFSVIADFWSLYIKHKYDIDIELTAADASMMLALFKVARGVTAVTQKLDTYVDICGYAACAGELECKKEEK